MEADAHLPSPSSPRIDERGTRYKMAILDGMKVLDFSTLYPGPYATMSLADMGADVLRVSSLSRKDADIVAAEPPYLTENVGAQAAWLSRNKRTISLNLKTEEAKQIVYELVKEYDVVLEQFRPGVADRMGIGYEELKRHNPSVVYCSLSGYGQYGPYCMKAGHDINYVARSGLLSHSGRKSSGPVLYGMQIADIAGGSMNSIIGILAAAYRRAMTGEGEYIDVSMVDCTVAYNGIKGGNYLAGAHRPTRESETLTGRALYDIYETKDGEYLTVGAMEPKFFAEFCRGIDMEELIEHGCLSPEATAAKPRVIERIKSKTLAEWEAIFADKDACVEPVLDLERVFYEDPHIKEREMVVEVPLPENGKIVKQIANPIKYRSHPNEYRHAAYPLGFHTKDVMRELGYSDERIAELEEHHVFD